MQQIQWAVALAATALAACSMPPAGKPTGPAAPSYALEEVRSHADHRGGGANPDNGNAGGAAHVLNDDIINSSADSSQAGFDTVRALDKDSNTEWASGGFQQQSADLVLQFGHPHTFTELQLKTGPTKGSFYVASTSYDGSDWQIASSHITIPDGDWEDNSFPLSGSGSYLKLHWVNTGNVDHAAIFDLTVYGKNVGRRLLPLSFGFND